MINAMRTLALDYLFDKLGDKNNSPKNLEDWYHEVRTSHPELLFPFLVESVHDIEKVYILKKDVDENTLRLVVEDITEEKAKLLPFMKPTGSQSAQIGPAIKRTYSRGKGAGPSAKILKTTMESFKTISCAKKPWSGYFDEVVRLLERPKLKLLDNSVINWKELGYENLLIAAVDRIGEQKKKALLTIKDEQGKFPGQRPEYLNYLMTEKLGGTRYATGKTFPKDNEICLLCGASGVKVFPNALKGAGINLNNVDREGAFPGIDITQAWKKYPLCGACADLLYIYKFHVLKKDSKGRNPYITSIAGDSALVIPFTTMDYQSRLSMWRKMRDFIKSISSDVEEDEAGLLDLLKDEEGILNLTFLWANVGQDIENVSGMITDVPPTRLAQLSKINDESRYWKHPLFPEIRYFKNKKFNFHPDLSLRALKTLFFRPGGNKAKDANASMKLQQLRRNIAACVYHKEKLPESRFWEEIMTTARWYWLDAIDNGSSYGLLNEGKTKKGETYLTAACWTKHLCWWIYYFKKLEVMDMENNFYKPNMENLKPYFGPESGINLPQKAFAFLLGVLYGKVLQVQGARGVNVGANALTWLKRLTLKGKDLPELYIKIREKLLAYGTEKSEDVNTLITEIGNLGVQLGDNIDLDDISTNYYLLLGQSMTTTILPTKKEDKKDG